MAKPFGQVRQFLPICDRLCVDAEASFGQAQGLQDFYPAVKQATCDFIPVHAAWEVLEQLEFYLHTALGLSRAGLRIMGY